MSTDAVVLAANRLAGLSWGDRERRREYSLLLAPWDGEERAILMAGTQSSCALALMAAFLIAEIDGTVRRWRGKEICDPLREPRWGHYDSLPYLEHLAIQRGIRKKPNDTTPEFRPGVWFCIGGEPHVGIVVSARDGGWETIEGGQPDPFNRRPSPQNCTRILRKVRRLSRRDRRWFVGERPLLYYADAGLLPCANSGMPWSKLWITP